MNRRAMFGWVLALLLLAVPRSGAAGAADPFQFFDSEANVISASLQPQPLRRAPASVYVITADELRASGTHTLWDALRSVPGVDVMSTRTFQGEVSIRGLNKTLNNRTLVLVDGRSVLNGYFDFVTWEGIPVTIEEIDRIEIVEGPVSALYGANAINGVINIITKTPEQIDGGVVGVAMGEQATRLGTALVGRRYGRLAVKSSVSTRHVDQFDQRAGQASQVAKFHASSCYEFSPRHSVSLSGGLADMSTEVSAGVIGTALEKGLRGHLRTELELGESHVRAYWNRGRTQARHLPSLGDPDLYFDTYDLTADRTLINTARHSLTLGASGRVNTMVSQIFGEGTKSQNLWAAFGEDRFAITPKLDLLVSGRLDRHPLAGAMFSPRGSIVYAPRPNQSWRVSAGSAFRNPTLTENYLEFTQSAPNPGTEIPDPPYDTIAFTLRGNRDLSPERLTHLEVGHSIQFGRLQATAVAFRYRLDDLISTAGSQDPSSPPVFKSTQSFINRGSVTTWGGELAMVAQLTPLLSAVGNLSHQQLHESGGPVGDALGSPRNKVSGGLRFHAGDVTANAMAHGVSSTMWPLALTADYPAGYARLPAYATLDLSLGYRPQGSLKGMTIGLSAFNAADNQHYEILPALGAQIPGQGGERIGRRVVANLSYSFK